MNNTVSNSSKRELWLGTTFWVVIGGLVFLMSAFLAENFDWLTFQQCLYRLDYRYWFPDFAYPLWLMFAFFAFDAITYRQPRVNTAELGRWRLRLDAIIFSIKMCLIILIAYFILNMCAPFHRYWLWWEPANLLLLAFFLMEWSLIYKTSNRINVTPEMLNVRKRFLMMTLTLTVVLGIYNILLWTSLLRPLYEALWIWFGFGGYSHLAALAFGLICVAIGMTFFVVKEWLTAWRQVRKAKRKESSSNP